MNSKDFLKEFNSYSVTDIIIRDAFKVKKSKDKKCHSLFFKAVLGGSVTVVEKVIRRLQQSRNPYSQKLLKWMMGNKYINQKSKLNSFKLCSKKLLKFLFLIPLWILLTPVLYFLHAFLNRLLNSKKMTEENFAISALERIQLPIVFAVMSGQSDMVRIFLEHGIPINVKDARFNNALHYISDLSAHSMSKARAAYRAVHQLMTMNCISEEEFYHMVKYERNKDVQNPIEYAIQFGNLQFATMMVEDSMTENILNVTKDSLSMTTDKYCNGYSQEELTGAVMRDKLDQLDRNPKGKENFDAGNTNTLTSQEWTEKRFDITSYSVEQIHGFVSYMLHVLVARPTTAVSAENWTAIRECKSIQKWISLKFYQWKYCIIFSCLFECLLTFLIGFGLLQNTQGDMVLYPNKELFIKHHIHTFIAKWHVEGNSTINPSFSPSHGLREVFFSHYSDINTMLTAGEKELDYHELKGLIQKLPLFHSFTDSDMIALYNDVCVTGDIYFQVGDLIRLDNCSKLAADELLSTCMETGSRYSFYLRREEWEPYEFVIASSFRAAIYNGKRSIIRNILYLQLDRISGIAMIFILAAYFIIYLFLDIFCRTVTLAKQIQAGSSLYSIFGTGFHGSYVKGQVNVFCSFAYLYLIFYYWPALRDFYNSPIVESNLTDEILSYDRFSTDTIQTNFFSSLMLTLMLVCRIILHLHSLRLLPWIGSFVVTTFQMAFDLFQFAIVYVIVLVLFSLLIHFFSRDPNCPVFRDANNYNILDSVFSTYSLTFGHMEVDFKDNMPLKMVYVIFVVMCIILLLNLIIALMSSTAARVTAEPWASQLYEEGLLMEAIGIEHWMFTLFPCMRRRSYRRAGFIVKEVEGHLRVYIDVFDKFSTQNWFKSRLLKEDSELSLLNLRKSLLRNSSFPVEEAHAASLV